MLSIIIPTYNRCYILQKCLIAINNQKTNNHQLEIIVSDDGSTDSTEEITKEFTNYSRWPIQYFKQKNKGANAARNNAIRSAKGQIVLFINDDVLPIPRMINYHAQTHESYPAENIGVLGRVTIAKDIPYTPLSKLHLDASFEKLAEKFWLDWTAFFTCNVSLKTNFLLEHGLFDESLRYHEDVELSERLSAFDFKLKYVPEALGLHLHYLQEDQFLKVAQRDGKALAIWYKKSPHLGKKLTEFGFYPADILSNKLKYQAADLLFNKKTTPFFLKLAHHYTRKCENISLAIYRKLYQATKRKAIRDELTN